MGIGPFRVTLKGFLIKGVLCPLIRALAPFLLGGGKVVWGPYQVLSPNQGPLAL
jgi:hypothetical protein